MPARQRCLRLFLGFFCLFGWPFHGFMHAQNSAWFSKNDKGSRYEGLVDRPNAKRDYEVLGLYAYRESPMALTSTSRLQLAYFVPEHDAIDSITVKELQNETQYLMQAKVESIGARPGWNIFNDWPVSAVIVPNHVNPANLGVLVHLKDDAVPGILSPAILYSTKAPETVTTYLLEFVSHRALRNIHCTVLADRKPPGQPCERVNPRSVLEESQPIEFRFSAKTLREGIDTIRIEGEYANFAGAPLFVEVHFVHHAWAGGR